MPDAGFATNGSTMISFGEYNFGRATILIQSDGKIVLSGSASDTQIAGGAMHFVLARFSNSGILDTTFGANGTVKTLVEPGGGYAYAAFLMPDGKILVAGRTFSGLGAINFSSIRYQSNGQVDATYGSNGVSSSDLWFDYKDINAVLLQPDGKFLVALTRYNEAQNNYDFKVRRFNTDNTYDVCFGETYGITTSFYDGYDEAFSIGLQSNDKIVVGGTTHNGINYDFALTRYENEILGIPENEIGLPNVILYPNPTKDILHIKLPDGSQIVDCKIYTILGQLVWSGQSENASINIQNLASGIYAITISTESGTTSRKFVKQ